MTAKQPPQMPPKERMDAKAAHSPQEAFGPLIDLPAPPAETGLRQSDELFRFLADAAPVMSGMSGVDKLCTWLNKGWLDFTGRPLQKELGHGWADNVHADDYERCLNTYTTAVDSRQPFSMEYRLKRHDGEYRWLL